MPLDVGYLFLVGSNILLLMVVQQLVAVLESLQKKMSTCPSTPPSCNHSTSCLSHSVVSNWIAAQQASLSFTVSRGLLKLLSIESVMLSNHLILCHPVVILPSIFPSVRVFSSESALHISWPKYWSFSFSISPSNEHSGFISFRTDWFDLLAVLSRI